MEIGYGPAMNTQTHLLLASALFARTGARKANLAVLAGAFVPDGALFAMFLGSRIAGIPEGEFWGKIYFGPFVQSVQAVANSAPLYAAIALLGWILARQAVTPATAMSHEASPLGANGLLPLATLFGLAALTHLAGDFPVHVNDAHRHFWPLSDWRFRSPVSYWDPAHYGQWFSLFEMALGIALAVILWRRFSARWVRTLMGLAILLYIAVPAYFILMIGHHQP